MTELAKYIKSENQEVWLRKVDDEVEIEVNFVGKDLFSEGGATFRIPLKSLEEFIK